MTAADEVGEAARRLVAAFGSHRRADYFSCFATDATFVFYTTAAFLGSRPEYEAEFDRWEADGFRVLSCDSSDQRVQLAGDVGVFTHRVATRTMVGGEEVVS